MITSRFTIESRPTTIPTITTWYVKDLLAPGRRSPLVIAVCDSEGQALRVAAALAAYRPRGQYSPRQRNEPR